MSGLGYSIIQKPYQICYEHAFNTFHEHKEGTNEYIYKFPDHWTQYPGSLHALSLRSVNVHPAARDIGFAYIYLKSNEEDSKLDLDLFTNFTLAYDEDMNKFNDRMKAEIRDLYDNYKYESGTEWRPTDFGIFYKYSTNELVFKINDSNHYFAFTNSDDEASYTSTDLKNMIGIKSDALFVKIAKYQNLEITYEELTTYLKTVPQFEIKFRDSTKEVIEFKFKNVWNRGTLTINSTLSTLAEYNFLALSNVLYPVPKYYELNGFTTEFSISLFDACLKIPVELPADNRDLVIIEMILVAR